ncbi:DUF1750-domain-containing protein [Microthyrium microscopicum]|uniref:DUF1750-domain-containing protein n=1 Tax=Microthyrium microscopicum TaxID=703497 RepID=A0A6A6TXY5_9PEZI|nr:DUF1750-domain-containing protein [Microthyrium microscopicum]
MNGLSNPSDNVDPPLLRHLHLIVIPHMPRNVHPPDNYVIDVLAKAPNIVKERPVTWQFVSPQEPGTMFIEWIPLQQSGNFPSDGFGWYDPERSYEHELPGGEYVMDILIHYGGIIPESPQNGIFSRKRYRIRHKHNSPHTKFDPCFWLVLYGTAEMKTQQAIQQNRPQFSPQTVALLQERHALAQYGMPQRKEFMLADQRSWPKVHYPPVQPGQMQPGQMPPGAISQNAMYQRRQQAQMQMGQPGHYPPYAGSASGPPAKRVRQAGPAQAGGRGPPVSLKHEADLELLEDTSAGDYLDHISPATISRDRFKRHHLWLEDVFSSLYTMNQVMPEDLGFGLVGELGELTKDLLESPAKRIPEPAEVNDGTYFQDPHYNAPKIYKKLEPEQFAEFEKRVADFVESKNREMDEMREEHAKTMATINSGRFYLDVEDRLREAGTDSDKIDEIMREVEAKMGISVQDRQDIVCVQKGALEDEERPVNGTGASNGQASASNDVGASLLDEFTSTADFLGDEQSAGAEEGIATDNLDLIDTMDIDIPDVPVIESESAPVDTADAPKADGDWVVVENQAQTTNPAAPTTTVAAPVSTETTKPATDTPEAAQANTEGDAGADTLPESMFDGEEFSAFADNLDPNASLATFEGADGDGDGILDFDNAFGTNDTPAGN